MIWSIIILLLVIVILILAITIYYVFKRSTYLSEREKEMVNFAIDIYIDYGEELDVLSDKHDIIVKELNKLKRKLNNGKGNDI